MSTSTNQPDVVTVPLDTVFLQKLLFAQVMSQQQQQQQQQQKPNPQPQGTSQASALPTNQSNSAQNSLPKGQNIQAKPPLQSQQQSKPLIKPLTTPNPNPVTRNPIGGVNRPINPINKPFNPLNSQNRPQTQNKFGQNQQESNSGPSNENKPQDQSSNNANKQALELLQKLLQTQGGQAPNIPLLSNLISQLGQNNNNNNSQQGGNENQNSYNNNNNGQRNNKQFAYSSRGDDNGNQRGGFGGRGGFNGRGGRGGFQNNRGGGFAGRGRNGDNNGGFQKRPFGEGGQNRFQGKFNRDDPSRSRSRDKSNPRFGGQGNFQQGDENAGGPRPHNTRKGDWTCPECKNSNYAIRTHCNRCHLEKPADLVAQDEERRSNAPTFKKGDWNCPICKNLNFAKRQNCNRCGGDRPEETMQDFKPGRRSMMGEDQDQENFGDNNNYDFGSEIPVDQGNQEMEEGEVQNWN